MEDRRFFKVLTRKAECTPKKLSFEGWLVFSYLHQWGKPCTAAKLASVLRIHVNTMTNVKAELIKNGFIKDGRKLQALEPPSGLFVTKATGGLAYWKYYLPSEKCDINNRENAVYWWLHSVKGVRSAKAVAVAVGVSRPTATKAIKVFRDMGLIVANKVTGIPPDWFRRVKKKVNYEELDTDQRTDYLYGQVLEKNEDTLALLIARVEEYEGGITFDQRENALKQMKKLIWLTVEKKWLPGCIIDLCRQIIAKAREFRYWQVVSVLSQIAANIVKWAWSEIKQDGSTGKELAMRSFYKFRGKWNYELSRTKDRICQRSQWDDMGYL